MKRAVIGLMLALGVLVAHAEDFKAFPACVDRESLAMIDRQVKAGAQLWGIDTDTIGEKVYEICSARHLRTMKNPPFLWDLRYAQTVAVEKLNGLKRADIDRQKRERAEREATERKENAPKLEAEGEAANARYRGCLYNHARLLALNSDEPADTVTRATFASCRAERAAIAEVHARYKDRWFDEETLVRADKLLSDKVLLEVIKQRALPRSAPANPPAAPKSDRGA